jgi:hypothetical protein
MTGKSPIPVFVRRVKPRNKKYSPFQNTQISGICFPVPVRPKGTYRAIVTYVGPECDGRSDAALSSLRDDGKAAYGEVVWSWRRDRGVYPARLVAGSATVTINAAYRGEHV